MIQIIPAILATTEEKYKNDIAKLLSCQSLKGGWVHIDFADNKFVQNKTIKPETVGKFPNNFRKEAHLMVLNPKEWIDDLIKAGFERIIIHIEAEDIDGAINYIKSKGLSSGIALKNETELEKVLPFIDKIDILLIMSVNPGFQGQPFIQGSLDRIMKAKNKGENVKIGVDGAVKDTNIKDIVKAGADFVIMGSYLLQGDTEKNLERVWEVING